MYKHFIAKITTDGGPDPELELEGIVRFAEQSDDGCAWFATRLGKGVTLAAASSICLIVHNPGAPSPLSVVLARVVDKRSERPDVPGLAELYDGPLAFNVWWKLKEPMLIKIPGLADIPGRNAESKRPAQISFRGSLQFGFWEFDTYEEVYRSLDQSNKRCVVTPPAVQTLGSTSVDKKIPPAQAVPHVQRIPQVPLVPLYGVDFSGGTETSSGNKKIWIASWDERGIRLRCGTDNAPFCRRDLPGEVAKRGGWWVFDFPFGIPTAIAQALDIPANDWRAWLSWCGQTDNATELRNRAKSMVAERGACWSTRRRIDIEHSTTWFPLFEQLYRQTIYGCGTVLKPLASGRACMLPWDDLDPDPKRAKMVEGFPGMTISTQLGLSAKGYKHNSDVSRDLRKKILAQLNDGPLGSQLSPELAERAAKDAEGDAVDALVLLAAAKCCQELAPSNWVIERSDLEREGLLVEGSFPPMRNRVAL